MSAIASMSMVYFVVHAGVVFRVSHWWLRVQSFAINMERVVPEATMHLNNRMSITIRTCESQAANRGTWHSSTSHRSAPAYAVHRPIAFLRKRTS